MNQPGGHQTAITMIVAMIFLCFVIVSKAITWKKVKWAYCRSYNGKNPGSRCSAGNRTECLLGRGDVFIALLMNKIFLFEAINFLCVVALGIITFSRVLTDLERVLASFTFIAITYGVLILLRKLFSEFLEKKYKNNIKNIATMCRKEPDRIDVGFVRLNRCFFIVLLAFANVLPVVAASAATLAIFNLVG